MSSNDTMNRTKLAELIRSGVSFFFEATDVNIENCPVVFYSVIQISDIWKVSVKGTNSHYHLGSFNKQFELDLRGSDFNTNDIEVTLLHAILSSLNDIPENIMISL